MAEGGSAEELLKQLQVQAEANRAAAVEASSEENLAAYRNPDGKAVSGTTYRIAGDAVIPEGTALAANYDPNTGEVVWVETFEAGDPNTYAEQQPCANGVDCLDSDFCFGWYECDPCEWCENNKCQPRDPERPCSATWECPCAPNENQHYECVDDECLLTCAVNADCGECEVCDLVSGYCGPGCQSDADCDPTRDGAAGDAQENTFCVDCECVFACDPVRFCNADADCLPDEYCGPREHRVASDPEGIAGAYMCLSGCRNDDSCENEGETCDFESRLCVTLCEQDSDCLEDEACNDDGRCSTVGAVCFADGDCDPGEYCKDGRCTGGCATDDHCVRECGKLQSCIDSCPPDPTCTCEGDGCYNENWRDLCPRDPACIAACPEDGECLRQQGSTCVDNRCERTCTDSAECLDDEVCSEGICMVRLTEGEARADDRLGCQCGDVCNRYGTCEVAICTADEQCPSCSICEDGVCIPGCSDENPCPDGGCCNPDGRCSRACTQDYQCADLPGNQLCLETGCCGLICDPLVPCVGNSDCQAGEYCAEEGYCLPGCRNDGDCAALAEEDGGLYRCDFAYVRAPNGALAPCSFYPGEECFSEIGQCTSYCITSSDCEEGYTCDDGSCTPPPEPTCSNDSECAGDDICLDGRCRPGCRFDKDCPEGEGCFDNGCQTRCETNELCRAALGEGYTCLDGYCQLVNSSTGQKRRGCECYEFCDEQGYCTPYQCDSDLDCEEEACGSCLVGNTCGECFSDEQCPGTKVCDLPLDELGNPKLDPVTGEQLGGTCAYACTPDSPGVCLSASDCPDGFYCDDNTCQRGCQDNDGCLPGQVCRSGQCQAACPNGNCPPEHICVQGACLFNGNPCDRDNNLALQIREQIAYTEALRDQAQEGQNEESVESLDAQLEVLAVQLENAENRDCPSGQVCDGSQCVPPPVQCVEDFECDYPDLCILGTCQPPANADSYAAFDPDVIGCPSCADTCVNGKCKPQPCTRNDDCGCGTCSASGICVETCRNDLDCGAQGVGRCVGGECVECLTNWDCQDLGRGAVCDGGECKTPCFTELSTGSCLDGLNDGDTCQACPEQCPPDAPCRKTPEVCSYSEVYDPISRRTRIDVNYCQKCSRECITSSDCEEGTVCGGFGICELSDGRCEQDSDCYDDSLAANNGGMRCRNNICIQLGETCFTASDCDIGEVCDGGECKAGTCGDQDPCSGGKTCVDNTCVWQCGSGADVLLCGSSQVCPPGMYCAGNKGFGGFCIREGMSLSTLNEPGCPSGTICCGGGCVNLSQTGKQCCEDEQCGFGRVCREGICRAEAGERYDSDNPADEGRGQPQNNCEAQGLCCGEDGFCTDCACSDTNPCPGGQCCDRDSGTCVSTSLHPQTKYGAPYDCRIDRVYCEVLDPEGNAFDPNDLGGELFKGCEYVDSNRRIKRCWEGKEKSFQQTVNLMTDVCWVPKKKECRCEEDIPDVDECASDLDCGACGRCVEKTWINDGCCGVYGEGEYETAPGMDPYLGTDRIRRNVCEGTEEEDCGCRSDADCTECEYCDGGGANSLGRCVEDCDNKCFCGGPLSRKGWECKSCQDRYGPCAAEVTAETPEEVDPETGEITTPAQAVCACVVDRTKECCKGLASVEDMARNRTRCQFRSVTSADGATVIIQTETCYDEGEDLCAQCDVDADCPGNAICKGNKCFTECGKADSNPDNNTYDLHDVGGVGGDPYSCWCCSEQGQCQPLQSSWVESEGAQVGPWTITYVANQIVEEETTITNTQVTRTFTSSAEDYGAAEQELKNIYGDVQILNAQGSEGGGRCRPCECTQTGIECGPWKDCEACYRWVKEGDPDSEQNNAIKKGERIRLENEVNKLALAAGDAEIAMNEAFEKYQEAEGTVTSLRLSVAAIDSVFASEFEVYQEQMNALREQQLDLNETLAEKNEELAEAQRDYERGAAEPDTDEATLALLEQRYNTAQAEYDAAQANVDANQQAQDELQQQQDDRFAEASPQSVYLTSQLQAAEQEKFFAWIDLQEAIRFHRDKEQEHLEAIEALNDSLYPKTNFKQERTCDCCIEDTCRDDDECIYGTCWICIEEYSGEYEAALYGKISDRKIVNGQDVGSFPPYLVRGKTVRKLNAELDQCVAMPCGPYIKEEKLCSASQNRFYEYCTGGIISCVLSYNGDQSLAAEYMNGYEYETFCAEAGICFRSSADDYEQEACLGSYEFSDPQKSSCEFANWLGYIGGRTLPTFDDLVASHPICQKANLYHQCPEELPDCNIKLGRYYQKGDNDWFIEKLRKEIKQLEAYIQALNEQAIAPLETLKASAEGALAPLEALQESYEQALRDAIQNLVDLLNFKDQLEDSIPDLEQAVADAQENVEGDSGAEAAFDDAVEALNEARQLLNEAYEIKTLLEADLELLELNLRSARAAANQLYLERDQLNQQIAAINAQLANVQPGSAEEIQLLAQLADTEAERDLVAADYAEVSGQVVDLELQRRLLTCEDPNPDPDPESPATICEAEDLISQREFELSNAQEDFQDANDALEESRNGVQQAINLLAVANQQLLNTNQAIESAEEQVDFLTEQAGGERYEPTACCEDEVKTETISGGFICCGKTSSGARDCSTYTSLGCTIRDCGEVCQRISNVQSVIDAVDDAIEEVNLEIESAEKAIEVKEADLQKYINDTGEIAYAVVRTKDEGLSSEEDLREQLKANVELDEYLAEQDPWPPRSG